MPRLLSILSRSLSDHRSQRFLNRGFALPTVLISATVMLIVLLAAVQGSVSVNQAINTQYADKIAKEAAESGIAMAKECNAQNGSVTWLGRRLQTNSDCTGADAFSCPPPSMNPSCYLFRSQNYRTKFVVTAESLTQVTSQGIADEIRTTSGDFVNRTTYTIKLNLTDPTSLKAF